MAAITLPKKISKAENKIIDEIASLLKPTHIVFGNSFTWSPKENIVIADKSRLNHSEGLLALLHEAGHALLKHQRYTSDIDLLLKEVAAWDEAKKLAKKFNIEIDKDHIEDCLDTYRDWLFKRCQCPNCGAGSLQVSTSLYECINCQQNWRVSNSRFCRTYRLTKKAAN